LKRDAATPAHMRVRVAEPRDFEATAALLQELGGMRPPLPAEPAARERVRAVFERHLQRAAEGRGFLFVAEADGRVVGMASADVRERLAQQTPEVWVADLVVTEGARGRGVGKALLDRVTDEARRLGAHRISLESGHWRKDAHRFYAREGYEDLARHFSKAVGA